MIFIRKAAERGHTDAGWLNSWHSFSFGEYRDPNHMGFRTLRVINDDQVAAGSGFGTHAHRDMEIISYVVAGGLEHKDSIGTGSVIRPGEVQRMTAGTGIRHSEYNASKTEPVHFLQIWILPERAGLEPGYEQKAFSAVERSNQLRLVADRQGSDGAVTLHQDVRLYASMLTPDAMLRIAVPPGRYGWLQVVQGVATLQGRPLQAGDGVAIAEEHAPLELKTTHGAEVLFFDLA